MQHRPSELHLNSVSEKQTKRLSRKLTSTFSLQPQQFKHQQSQQSNSKVYLKLDSPRTQEAIRSLGMDLDAFQYKTLEDFGNTHDDPDIKQLRYQHYLKQTQKDIRSVIQKRKRDIIQSNKLKQENENSQQLQQIQQQQKQYIKQNKRSSLLHRDGLKNISLFQEQLGTIPSVQSEKRMTKQELNNLFSKTTTYLEQNHKSPRIEDGEDLLELDERDTIPVEDKVGIEINRYNKAKIQKQLEAKTVYDLELRKMKGQKQIKEREERIEMNKIRAKIAEFQKKEQKKHENQQKIDRIKYEEERYKEQKQIEREQIKKKLHHIKQRQEKEAQQKKQQLEQKQRLQEEKKLKIQAFLDYQDLKEEQELYERLGHMHQKQQMAELQSRQNKENTVRRIQSHNFTQQQKAQIAQEFKKHVEEEMVSSFIEKIDRNNEEQKKIQQKIILKEIERAKENEEKQHRYHHVILKNKENSQEKTSNLKERFQRKEENLAKKRQEDEKQRKIKTELRILKEQELKEINVRNKRKDIYVKDKIFEREKKVQERVEYQKDLKQFFQKIKSNISKNQKEEANRIFDKLLEANNKLFPYVSNKETTYLPEKQKSAGLNLLSQVLNESDLERNAFDKPKVEKKED